MTNMNDWNDLQQRRGAVAALEKLHAEIAEMGAGSARVFVFTQGDLLGMIGIHINKYK